MNQKTILITGGAGFIGSHLAVRIKEDNPTAKVIVIDNLYRKGSELNVSKLGKAGAIFIKGDIRYPKDLNISFDLLIECAAEPSAINGFDSSPEYLVNSNLVGAINCFEQARKNKADVVFLSTSRVYPWRLLNSLNFLETDTRFELSPEQKTKGASSFGISEDFPLQDGTRSIYGATKLASELLLREGGKAYDMNGIINRLGTVSGPGQFGKSDQGIIMYWLLAHLLKKPPT